MGTKVKRNLYSPQPGMYWKRHLQHVDSDKDHCRECEAGTVRFRLYTRWKQTAATPYQSFVKLNKEKGALACLSCNRSENRYRKLFQTACRCTA